MTTQEALQPVRGKNSLLGKSLADAGLHLQGEPLP